jgi:hypothetical protein
LKLLATFLFVLFGQITWAQVPDWHWAAPGSGGLASGRGITRTPDGNYTMAGHFQEAITIGGQTLLSSGDDDVLLVQYNAGGQMQWAKRAGGLGHDGAIANDAAGNIYVAGYFAGSAVFEGTTLVSAGADDAFLAKYTGAGVLLWIRQAGSPLSDYAAAVAVDNAGAVVVAGQYQGNLTLGAAILSAGATAGFLAEYDAQGELLWSQSMTDSMVNGLATNQNGEVYVTGTFAPTAALLTKFSSTGTRLWTSANITGVADGTSVAVATGERCTWQVVFGAPYQWGLPVP